MCTCSCHARSPCHAVSQHVAITVLPSYAAHYPVLLAKEQPPEKQLRSPHPMSALFKLGIVSRPPVGKHIVRKCSIVPAATSKEFKVCSNNAHAPGIPFGEGWLQMEISMPMVLGPEDDAGQGGKCVHHALPIVLPRLRLLVDS